MLLNFTSAELELMRDAASIMSPDSETQRHALDLLFIRLEAAHAYAVELETGTPLPDPRPLSRWRVTWQGRDLKMRAATVDAATARDAERKVARDYGWTLETSATSVTPCE